LHAFGAAMHEYCAILGFTLSIGSVFNFENLPVNTLYFLWSIVRSAYQAFGRNSDKQEQHDVDAYLSQAQSFADLEYRQRQWLQSR
jgi:hypothetical protein